MIDKLKDAEKKVIFAEFLLSRDDNRTYQMAAVKHLMAAANLVLQHLTPLNEQQVNSSQLVQAALEKFQEREVKDFGKFYLNFWKIVNSPAISSSEVEKARTTIRNFIEWIKKEHYDLD